MQERNIFFSIARPPPEGLLAISPERSKCVIFFLPERSEGITKGKESWGLWPSKKKRCFFLVIRNFACFQVFMPKCKHAVVSVYSLSGMLGIIHFAEFILFCALAASTALKVTTIFFQDAIWRSNFPNKVRYFFDHNLNAKTEKSSEFFLNCRIAGKGKEKRGGHKCLILAWKPGSMIPSGKRRQKWGHHESLILA